MPIQSYGYAGRRPRPDCAAEQDAITYLGRDYCTAHCPTEAWVCTRTIGHKGPHVAARSNNTILVRWGWRD